MPQMPHAAPCGCPTTGCTPAAAGTPCRSSGGSSRKNKGVRGLQIRFDEGRYDFYPDAERQAAGKPTTAFALTQTDGVEIDGGGCDWIFHGLMNPVRLSGCRNTTLRNVRIDWQQPYNSQATIVSATDTYLDMEIDAGRYPYVVAGDSLAFVGEYGLQRIVPEYTNLYTPRRTNCSTRRATYRWAATCSGPGSPTSGTTGCVSTTARP